MEQGNLLADLDALQGPDERFDQLLATDGVRGERIGSIRQASPPGFWYDQKENEWVTLLAGAAELHFEDEPAPRRLQPGDWIDIPAHRRHRVAWTTPDQPTVWLAIHYRA